MDDRSRGLYRKFNVTRTDGRSEPGAKHSGCDYLVLDLDHDPCARGAAVKYAELCRRDGYVLLADDILRHVSLCTRIAALRDEAKSEKSPD